MKINAPDFNTASPSALTRSSCVNAPKCARDEHSSLCGVGPGVDEDARRLEPRASRLPRVGVDDARFARASPSGDARTPPGSVLCPASFSPLSFFAFVFLSSRRSLVRASRCLLASRLVCVSPSHRVDTASTTPRIA